MKTLRTAVILAAAGAAAGATVAAAPSTLPTAPHAGATYAEQYRPQYHFSPPSHWMNDPNGMVYWDGEYHLFYQYNPDAQVWGPMHWGHAVATDLTHWRHLPIALYPDAHGTIFSGSAVADLNNTSGLGTTARPPLVAIYTSHDEARKLAGHTDFQTQSMAYSTDRGRSWTPYPGNPVLKNPGLVDFRDPKVSWFEPQKKWVMTLVAGDHVSFYTSRDLKAWQHESDFGKEWGAHGGVWECPDLIEMPVDSSATPKYVLLVSVNPGGPNGGSATQYFVGDFDGRRFVLDADWQRRLQPRSAGGETESAVWVDYGTDDYAGVTWSNLPSGRHVFLGWMSNWRYAQQVPTHPWRSAMTVPRELTLVPSARGLELRSLPVKEIAGLRGARTDLPAQWVRGELDLTHALGNHSGRLDLELTLDTAANLTTLTFRNAGGDRTVFRINRSLHRYELDRARSGAVDFHPEFAALQFAPLLNAGTATTLRVLLDHSSVEIFINQGETVMTAIDFPATPYTRIDLQADQPVEIKSGAVHELAATWAKE